MAINIEKVRAQYEKAVGKQPFSRGLDWNELSLEEEYVFDIEPERWRAMLVAYDCYSGITGQCHNDWYDPEYSDPSAEFSREAFLVFAKELGLTYREAFAVWAKVEWWEIRTNLTFFKDEQETGASANRDEA